MERGLKAEYNKKDNSFSVELVGMSSKDLAYIVEVLVVDIANTQEMSIKEVLSVFEKQIKG